MGVYVCVCVYGVLSLVHSILCMWCVTGWSQTSILGPILKCHDHAKSFEHHNKPRWFEAWVFLVCLQVNISRKCTCTCMYVCMYAFINIFVTILDRWVCCACICCARFRVCALKCVHVYDHCVRKNNVSSTHTSSKNDTLVLPHRLLMVSTLVFLI